MCVSGVRSALNIICLDLAMNQVLAHGGFFCSTLVSLISKPCTIEMLKFKIRICIHFSIQNFELLCAKDSLCAIV